MGEAHADDHAQDQCEGVPDSGEITTAECR